MLSRNCWWLPYAWNLMMYSYIKHIHFICHLFYWNLFHVKPWYKCWELYISKCQGRNIDTISRTRKPRSEGNFCLEVTIMTISFVTHKKTVKWTAIKLKEISIMRIKNLEHYIEIQRCLDKKAIPFEVFLSNEKNILVLVLSYFIC